MLLLDLAACHLHRHAVNEELQITQEMQVEDHWHISSTMGTVS
jgi:hypothetical protein